jgi:SAM-dependent methyltransferase
MSGWGGGYVTDIAYMPGWYRQQSPATMAIACLLGNTAASLPRGDDPVTYLELGCGQGYGAMLLAACNPAWRVTAVDFNPAHIAAAREWAADIGLTNIKFLEADLATLAEEPAGREIEEADYVSLHGVWSWVPTMVRAGIVRLLAAKVRPGGVVHISYNLMPGWGPAMGMQRLLREAGRRLAWRSDRQAEEGMGVVKALFDADASQLHKTDFVEKMLRQIGSFPVEYLAHEYMNAAWAPCYHADVAEDLAGAKLEWAAAAELPENFPELMISAAQRAVVQRFDDPLMRELIKDMCLDRALRHDVFVRGPRRISARARNEALMDVSLNLNIDPADMPFEAPLPAGKAELNQAFYQPIVQALRDGPRRVGDLLNLPDVAGRRDNPAELIGIMVGMNLAEPAARPDAGPGPIAMRFNEVVARRLGATSTLGRGLGLASHRLGGGIVGTVLDAIVVDRVSKGPVDPETLLRELDFDPSDTEKLRGVLEKCFSLRLPILRRAGVF